MKTTDSQESELRLKMRETPEGQFLGSTGLDYYDTESSARRVAEKAVSRIAEIESQFTEIVTAARALLTRAIAGLDQSATDDGLRNGQVIARMRAALENVAPPVSSPPALTPFGDGTWLLCDVPELHPRLETFGFRNGEANIMSGAPAKAVAAGLVSFPTPADAKPYAYAVKAATGYIANQGDQWWHEIEPVGWALFGTREKAESIAGLHGGEVVPVFKPAKA